MIKVLDKLFKQSKKIKIGNKSKLVIMSDCHRGSGDNYDNFIKNKNVFEAALNYYYDRGFTYIELGDGDEMWEVVNYNDIIEEYLQTFKIMKKYHDSNRLIMIYGNHDVLKKNRDVLEKYFYKYNNKLTKKEELLFNNLKVYESLLLDYNGYDIFLLHGHQIDMLNGYLWRFSWFLVRNIWKKLENVGIKAPTSAARNHMVNNKQEKKLKKWSIRNNKIIIAGHTHRPIFPEVGKSLYFNDGSCVHPNGITCLEIKDGSIILVKWAFALKDSFITVQRIEITKKEEIVDFFFNK